MKRINVSKVVLAAAMSAVLVLGAMSRIVETATGANQLKANANAVRAGNYITLSDTITLIGNDLPNNVTVRVRFYGRGRYTWWQKLAEKDLDIYVGQGNPARGSNTAEIQFQVSRGTLGTAFFRAEARGVKYEGIQLPKSLIVRDSNIVQVAVR